LGVRGAGRARAARWGAWAPRIRLVSGRAPVIEGHLDAEAGTALRTAIDSVLGPRARDDERPPALRRAHAFNELVRRCLDAGELPVRGGQRPHIVVYASLETLRGDPGAPAAELAWGWPISGQAARRLACGGDVTPLLVD